MADELDELKNKGFIVQIDEPSRVEAILWSIDENGYFTENVSYPDLKPQAIGLYLIGFSREVISCVAIGLQTGRTSTQSDRIKLKRICRVKERNNSDYMPDGALGQEIENRLAEQSDISIEANSMNQILARIVNQNPDKAGEINTLIRLANGIEFDDEKKNQIFSQQKDAVLFAMSISSIDSEIVTENWEVDGYGDAEDFLAPINQEHAIEDYLLNFDQDFFLDWDEGPPPHIHTRVFQGEKNQIAITNINRENAENTLGVDLIFYNDIKKSFCFVQYKVMQEKNGFYKYYPNSDANFAKELAAMRKWDGLIAKFEEENPLDDIDAIDEYRAFESPFAFKFCRKLNFDPLRKTQVDGFFVPLDIWDAFEESERKGTRGALVVDQGKVEKILQPKVMREMIVHNMIGTQTSSNKIISPLVRASLEHKHSVVLAIKEKLEQEEDDDET